MKFLVIHNDYGTRSGEEVTVDNHCRLLREHGHTVIEFRRSSAGIAHRTLGRTRAFWTGLYSPASRRDVQELVRRERPDVSFVQNLYPLISPSILPVLRQERVPVLMRVANFRLFCPNGLLFTHGEVCTRCVGGKEYWCILRNCEESVPKSVGYALRNAVARRRRYHLDNVVIYITATNFLRQWLMEAGIEQGRIRVAANPVPIPGETIVKRALGKYVRVLRSDQPRERYRAAVGRGQGMPRHRVPDCGCVESDVRTAAGVAGQRSACGTASRNGTGGLHPGFAGCGEPEHLLRDLRHERR